MTKEINQFKAQARRLEKFLEGKGLKYSECLEAIAAIHGLADWRTLQGVAKNGGLEAGCKATDKTNIWTWQFNEGDASRPVISTLLIQDEAGENRDFYHRHLHLAFSGDDEAQDYLRQYVECQLAGTTAPQEVVDYLAEIGEEMALDWGDEYEAEGLTIAELVGMTQIGSDMWQLADGRKLQFLYTRTAGSAADSPVVKEVVKEVYVGDRAITPLIESIAKEHLGDNVWGEHPKYPRDDWAQEAMDGDTWQSYPIWLLSKLEAEDDEEETPRYLVSEGWEHLFGPGSHETTVRFVFDREENRIIFMEFNEVGRWSKASQSDIADVQDSLLNANSEALTEPEDFDCENSDELPEWAKVN